MLTVRPSCIVAGAALLLTGCTAQWPVHVYVPPGDERIVYDGIADAQPVRVKYVDVFEREEYARFAADGAQAEFIYATAVAMEVSMQYSFTLQAAARTWTANRGKPMDWGAEGNVTAPRAGLIYYRPYTLGPEGRACVAVQGTWDYPPDDPNHWPGKVLFGYHCAAPGQTLSTAEIERLVASIGVAGREARLGLLETIRVDRRAGLGPGSVAEIDPDAVRAARGTDTGGRYGNPRHPFNFGVKYSVTNGDWRN